MTRPLRYDLARNLRRTQTDAGLHLWRYSRSRQFGSCKFRRQQPIGKYIADFVCLESRLIVELDGGQHVDRRQDEFRTGFLNRERFRVLRFWNGEVLTRTAAVLEQILLALTNPSPNPLPQG